MEITGTAISIGERYNRGNLTLRDLILETSEKYPQKIKIDFLANNCDLLDNVRTLEELKIFINLKGREWEDPATGKKKYFNSIQGWKIEKVDFKL